jgi:hypothetical protein
MHRSEYRIFSEDTRVSIVDHQGKLIGRFGKTPAGTELASSWPARARGGFPR